MGGVKTRAEIVSISVPAELASSIRSEAKAKGVSRSRVIQEAVRRYLWSQRFHSLQKFGYGQSLQQRINEKDVNRLVNEYRQSK